MRIAIVTDAWAPQVNGVVRTLGTTCHELEARGHEVEIIAPCDFGSVPCPTYPEIRLALTHRHQVGERIRSFSADALHIATEGPLGIAARNWAVERGRVFTTAYHTRFPEYLARRTRLPAGLFWRFISWFHGAAATTLVATPSLREELAARGLLRTRLWSRGVDLTLFKPEGGRHPAFAGLEGPIQLYVGRLAVEKSVEKFLALETPGTKVVVGDGPQRAALHARYPRTVFLGVLTGEALAAAYRTADVFVFPSSTDTFGLVMIEALACGTPVAAFDVNGPRDILTSEVGAMSTNLDCAIAAARHLSRTDCSAFARGFGWDTATSEFLAALSPLGESRIDWQLNHPMLRAA